jgi:hypothetical protein
MIKNIILNDKTIETIINLLKSSYLSYNKNNWQEYKYLKYCKKNLKNLIYLSSSTEISETTIKLMNLYISYYHNYKYNISYKGNEKKDNAIIEDKDDDLINNIDYLENINRIDIDSEDTKLDIDNNNNNDSKINIIENKFNNINIISIFRIRNYFYIYAKIKDEIKYDKIDIDKEKDFFQFFSNMKSISVKEKPNEKITKKVKNEEYRKALFDLQNLFQNQYIIYCLVLIIQISHKQKIYLRFYQNYA